MKGSNRLTVREYSQRRGQILYLIIMLPPGACLRNVRQLWATLKDGLSMRLLKEMCLLSGLEPPAALLQLPDELKQHCLSFLPVSAARRKGQDE
jgi:hypothetical protein